MNFEGQSFFPAFNASLNALAFVLLLIGFYFVKKKDFISHQKIMSLTFIVSSVFLASYLTYHFNYPATKFLAQGWVRPLYFFILISHIILAVGVLPFILRLLWVARKGEFQKHKKLARYVFPIWVYNSATGILVYFFLYQWFPASNYLEGALNLP